MNSNINPVVSEAVDKLNAQNSEKVQQEAVRLISCISKEQGKITRCHENIAKLREAGNALARNVVTEESVLGSPLPTNANHDTIAKVIEKANKDKQYNVEQEATRITAAIVSERFAIVLIEKRIKELRDALLKLTVPTVSVEQIVG